MEHKCYICGKTFATSYNLTKHQKNTKYCLKKAQSLMCKFCNNVSNDKNHLNDCIYYKNYKLNIELEKKCLEIEQLQQKCLELEEKLQKELEFKDELLLKYASKPNMTIKNYNNLNITIFPPEEEVKKRWENIICRDVLMGGIKTFAKLGHQNFLMKDNKSTVVCVDPARNKFMYINENEVIQIDMKLQKVTKKIFEPGAELALDFIRKLDVEDDDDEKLFNNAMPVSFISNINSPSNKEFIRHLGHYISLTTP